jgi:hypothetical protein
MLPSENGEGIFAMFEIARLDVNQSLNLAPLMYVWAVRLLEKVDFIVSKNDGERMVESSRAQRQRCPFLYCDNAEPTAGGLCRIHPQESRHAVGPRFAASLE